MKASFCIRIFMFAAIITFATTEVRAAQYYVVIGTFSNEMNALKFKASVQSVFKDVSYTYNASRKLYYVTVMKTSRKEEAWNWSLYLKNEKGFRDAWVLAEPDAESVHLNADNSGHDDKLNENMTAANRRRARYEAVQFPVSRLLLPDASSFAADAEMNMMVWTHANNLDFIASIKNVALFRRQAGPSARLFNFLVESPDGKVVPSEVMLVNYEQAKRIAGFQAGENVAIKGTKTEQKVTFVCDKLGYSQETLTLNLDKLDRAQNVKQNENGVWEVRIKLKPAEAYEIAFMNRTVFHKNAAILDSTSRKELDELVSIMQANPRYNVILHGHCNPGGKREILLPSALSNCFTMDGAVAKTGTDKVLTRKRVEVIMNYLVGNGIDKKRINTVAWGSMEPLVSVTGSNSGMNDRIEVEFVY